MKTLSSDWYKSKNDAKKWSRLIERRWNESGEQERKCHGSLRLAVPRQDREGSRGKRDAKLFWKEEETFVGGEATRVETRCINRDAVSRQLVFYFIQPAVPLFLTTHNETERWSSNVNYPVIFVEALYGFVKLKPVSISGTAASPHYHPVKIHRKRNIFLDSFLDDSTTSKETNERGKKERIATKIRARHESASWWIEASFRISQKRNFTSRDNFVLSRC